MDDKPRFLGGTLGTLIRTAMSRATDLRETAMESAGRQRVRLDHALMRRRRNDALAELGEHIYGLIESRSIDLAQTDLVVAELTARIAELEATMAEGESGDNYAGYGEYDEDIVAPGRSKDIRDAAGNVRVWRPVMPDDE